MNKLFDLIRTLRDASLVDNPQAWKNGAITVSVLAPALLHLDDLLQAFGLPWHITDSQAGELAVGIIAVFNIVVHFISGEQSHAAEKKPDEKSLA